MERPRFSFLDCLRGFAAVAVAAYHFGGRSNLPYLVPRAYLAVDLFFVLSGFVLANAYGARLGAGLSGGSFMRLRLIRLLPMLFVGTLFGAMIEFGRPGTTASLSHVAELAVATVLGSLALPIPASTSMEQLIFPINGPAWSLMFELVACVGFVALARDRTGWKAATVTMVIAGLLLAAVCITLRSLDVGSGLDDWPAGLPRVAYSFSAGLVVYAYRDWFPVLGAWVFPCVLIAIFSIPVEHTMRSASLDFVVIVVVMPCLVGSASNVRTGPRLEKWSRLSGEISYPLYAVHYPIVRAVCFLVARHDWGVDARLLVGAAMVSSLSLTAYALFIYYDVPVRRWLTSRLLPPGRRSSELAPTLAEKTPQIIP